MDFETVIGPHIGPLKRYVRFRIFDPADAEDVLQDVLLSAYRQSDDLENAESPKAWLIGVAKHKCADYYRRKAKRMEIPLESLDETALTVGLHGVTTKMVVHETLDRLGDTDKQILYLSCFTELPQAEIASRLGIPVGTVKSRLYHARLRFKEQYPEQSRRNNDEEYTDNHAGVSSGLSDQRDRRRTVCGLLGGAYGLVRRPEARREAQLGNV